MGVPGTLDVRREHVAPGTGHTWVGIWICPVRLCDPGHTASGPSGRPSSGGRGAELFMGPLVIGTNTRTSTVSGLSFLISNGDIRSIFSFPAQPVLLPFEAQASQQPLTPYGA